jgi:type VI secretion system protein ImpA
MLDLQPLLLPVRAEEPAGENLEQTYDYFELERSIVGKPEKQYGDTIVAAEGPDWNGVAQTASELLRQSKDLRIATYLTKALIGTEGLDGMAKGFELLAGLIERFWESIHPGMDEEGDATERSSALWSLTTTDTALLIRSVVVLESRVAGPLEFRSLVDMNRPGADREEAPNLHVYSTDSVRDAVAKLSLALRAAEHFDNQWQARVDTGLPDFSALLLLLRQGHDALRSHLNLRQDEPTSPTPSDSEQAHCPLQDSEARPRSAASFDEIRSRDDVKRALDTICKYYAVYEPSSPIPLLLDRCKRLVTMSFLDIVREMAPDGLSTVQLIAGTRDE